MMSGVERDGSAGELAALIKELQRLQHEAAKRLKAARVELKALRRQEKAVWAALAALGAGGRPDLGD